jgi:hypothetical protein
MPEGVMTYGCDKEEFGGQRGTRTPDTLGVSEVL